jgi:hypothetical protein
MHEPLRSRLLIVAGVVLGALGAAVTASRITALAWAWYAFAAALWISMMFAYSYFQRTLRLRPAALPLTPRGYLIHPVIPPGTAAAIGLVFAGTWLAPFNRTFPVHEVLFWLIVGLPFLMILLYAVLSWRETYVALTPQGIVWRTGYARRTISWDALAPGETHRPSIRDTWLSLQIARPELVTQRGLAFVAGSKEHPRIPLDIQVHPHLLTHAIDWYHQHPEHRAAIGTQAEHARLLSS